jgi:hypothetical protein
MVIPLFYQTAAEDPCRMAFRVLSEGPVSGAAFRGDCKFMWTMSGSFGAVAGDPRIPDGERAEEMAVPISRIPNLVGAAAQRAEPSEEAAEAGRSQPQQLSPQWQSELVW